MITVYVPKVKQEWVDELFESEDEFKKEALNQIRAVSEQYNRILLKMESKGAITLNDGKWLMKDDLQKMEWGQSCENCISLDIGDKFAERLLKIIPLISYAVRNRYRTPESWMHDFIEEWLIDKLVKKQSSEWED